MGGMLSTARMDECALLTYTIGLKPLMDDIDIISIDPHEVPVDFHHVYMVYKKEEFKNRALESFIEFASSFVPPESVVLRCSGGATSMQVPKAEEGGNLPPSSAMLTKR